MKKAFTLIELLIVVAIIAILAAIAVPNFLEAQTRSKIARVNSDMRTIATAIESYTVDNQRAPIGWTEGVSRGFWPDDDLKTAAFRLLTTPLPYLTDIPLDPFAVTAGGQRLPTGQGPRYLYENFEYPPLRDWNGDVYRRGYTWMIRSVGPSMVQPALYPSQFLGSEDVRYVYDPTNGTTSVGWILRTNKGMYPGR